MKADASIQLYKEIQLRKEILQLLPQKALYWPRHRSLFLADLHLGKATHFRKNGLAIPGNVHEADFQSLTWLVNAYQPRKIIFLGDLFHSELNVEWEFFAHWIERHGHIQYHLVFGNHDILPHHHYASLGFEMHEELFVGPFSFTHEEQVSEEYYNFSGHIHPGVKLYGTAKQGMRLPCFCFRENQAYLPAFGRFTGIHPIRKRKNDKIFAIAENEILSLQ